MKKFIAIFVVIVASLLVVTGCGEEELQPTEGLRYTLLYNGTYSVSKGIAGNNKNIVIPSQHNGIRVTEIGELAFRECRNLTSVTIPNSVTTIGFSAFSLCSSLTSITIPDSVTEIRDNAFWGCTSLTSITIPDSITQINYIFDRCTNLKTIKFKGTVEQWKSIEKVKSWHYSIPTYKVKCTDGEAYIYQ